MVYVFKTSVSTKSDVERLKPHLDRFPDCKWNFDLEDCDKILRIDATKELSEAAAGILRDNGFYCEELGD